MTDVTDTEATATDERLLLLIERVERLTQDKKDVSDDIKDVFLEAKSTGYNPKMMKAVIRERKKQRDDRLAEEAELLVYKCAVGLD